MRKTFILLGVLWYFSACSNQNAESKKDGTNKNTTQKQTTPKLEVEKKPDSVKTETKNASEVKETSETVKEEP